MDRDTQLIEMSPGIETSSF